MTSGGFWPSVETVEQLKVSTISVAAIKDMISQCGILFPAQKLSTIYNLSPKWTISSCTRERRGKLTNHKPAVPPPCILNHEADTRSLRCNPQPPDTISRALFPTHSSPANNLTVCLRICLTPPCPSTHQRRQWQASRRRHCGREESANELQRAAG